MYGRCRAPGLAVSAEAPGAAVHPDRPAAESQNDVYYWGGEGVGGLGVGRIAVFTARQKPFGKAEPAVEVPTNSVGARYRVGTNSVKTIRTPSRRTARVRQISVSSQTTQQLKYFCFEKLL